MVMRKYKRSKQLENLIQSTTISEFEKVISVSIHNACKHYNISDVLVKRYADEFDIKYSKKYNTLKDVSKEIRDEIISLYSYTLYTKRELSAMYNLSGIILNKIIKVNDTKRVAIQNDNSEFIEYTKLVRRLSTVTLNHFKLKCQTEYHWDHKISVFDGFKQSIPAYLIASRENFELVPIDINLRKGIKSSQTRDELYNLLGII